MKFLTLLSDAFDSFQLGNIIVI